MSTVLRRIRIAGGRDRVAVADLAVAAMNPYLAAPDVAQCVLRLSFGVALSIVVRARPICAGLADIPASARVGHDMSALFLAHLSLLLVVRPTP